MASPSSRRPEEPTGAIVPLSPSREPAAHEPNQAVAHLDEAKRFAGAPWTGKGILAVGPYRFRRREGS
jgi:hypothetical protein